MFHIVKVKASRPCRVRLYQNKLVASADVERPIGQPLVRGSAHGVVLDLVLTEAMIFNGPWIMNPIPSSDVRFEDTVLVIEPPAMIQLTVKELVD